MLNFYHWCKTPSSAFSQKNSATTPKFLHVFGRAASDLQLCFVQLKTLAPSARYLTLKPGLGVNQSHRKLYQWIRHPWLPINIPYSNHRPSSHRFRDKRRYPSKIANFSHPRILNAPMKAFPLEFGIDARGPECFYDGATRWSKKF